MMLRLILAATLVLTSAPAFAEISGTYTLYSISARGAELDILQLIEAPAPLAYLVGTLSVVELHPDGKITSKEVQVNGVSDGHSIRLEPDMGKPLYGTINGSGLELDILQGNELKRLVFEISNPEQVQSLQQLLKVRAQELLAGAKPSPAPENAAPHDQWVPVYDSQHQVVYRVNVTKRPPSEGHQGGILPTRVWVQGPNLATQFATDCINHYQLNNFQSWTANPPQLVPPDSIYESMMAIACGSIP